MANATRNRTLLVVLGASLGVGWFIGCSKPEPPAAPTPTPMATRAPAATPAPTPVCTPQVNVGVAAKDWTLTVGPDDPCVVKEGTQDVPLAVISKTQGHKITFQSSGGKKLAIIIHVPQGSPKPFKKMAYVGDDPQGLAQWVLSCDDPTKQCSTGAAGKDAAYGCYKYDQVLDGKKCDAGIIIEK